jgi:hypothetical protein
LPLTAVESEQEMIKTMIIIGIMALEKMTFSINASNAYHLILIQAGEYFGAGKFLIICRLLLLSGEGCGSLWFVQFRIM